MDCMEGMGQFPDDYFDLAFPDPQYGIGEAGKNHKSRNTPIKQKNGKYLKAADPVYKPKIWDNKPPSIEYFKELHRISKNQIIWGINYFNLPKIYTSKGRVIWDKINGDNDFSDCEIAYSSFHDSVRLFRYMWNGMMQGLEINSEIQQGNKKLNEKRIHCTQKPIKIYRWLLSKYASAGWKILDTHVGGGSSLIACELEGFQYVGFEIDPDYYKAATERIKRERQQLTLALQ